MFYQVSIAFGGPQPTIHVAHSVAYGHDYIWSSYPAPKTAKIDYSELFSFDPPSAFLFFFYIVGSVGFMKLFTYFGSKLGLDTVSEEPLVIPTRYFAFFTSFIYDDKHIIHFRIQISDIGKNNKRFFSPGASFKILFLLHCVFGIFVL